MSQIEKIKNHTHVLLCTFFRFYTLRWMDVPSLYRTTWRRTNSNSLEYLDLHRQAIRQYTVPVQGWTQENYSQQRARQG